MQRQTSAPVRHPAAATVSAAETTAKPGRYDSAARRRAKRTGREKGCWLYIPRDELVAAGIDPDGPTPWYRARGRQRSANACAVIIDLYREP